MGTIVWEELNGQSSEKAAGDEMSCGFWDTHGSGSLQQRTREGIQDRLGSNQMYILKKYVFLCIEIPK